MGASIYIECDSIISHRKGGGNTSNFASYHSTFATRKSRSCSIRHTSFIESCGGIHFEFTKQKSLFQNFSGLDTKWA